MSRSRRKTPIFGITTAESDKWFKSHENRRQRRVVKIEVEMGVSPTAAKAFGNPWSSTKDGKRWWNKASAKDMRK